MYGKRPCSPWLGPYSRHSRLKDFQFFCCPWRQPSIGCRCRSCVLGRGLFQGGEGGVVLVTAVDVPQP